jgi:hypothetical protein
MFLCSGFQTPVFSLYPTVSMSKIKYTTSTSHTHRQQSLSQINLPQHALKKVQMKGRKVKQATDHIENA